MTVEVKLRKELPRPVGVIVCGLPGSGYVAKLAVDHLVRELGAELVAEVYCDAFPPQVVIKRDGTVAMVRNELYGWRGDGDRSLLLYTGDAQPVTPAAEYELAEEVLRVAREAGATTVYTFGAYITGEFKEHPKVYGTATEAVLVKELEGSGVHIMTEGAITGMNGLLLGVAKLRGMTGMCLLGETSGYVVDPKAAQIALEVLAKRLGIQVAMTQLEERAKEVESIVRTVEQMQRGGVEKPPEKGRLGYIS